MPWDSLIHISEHTQTQWETDKLPSTMSDARQIYSSFGKEPQLSIRSPQAILWAAKCVFCFKTNSTALI